MLHILNHNDEIVDYFDISDGDILNPNIVRNIETLEDTLEFSVISERSLHVQERNRVIIKDNENEYREFIIMQYEGNIDGFTDVSCVGSHLEDFASAKPFKPQKLERYSTNQAITFLSADTGWELAPDNEWSGLRTTSWSSWKDRLSILKQLQTTYDMRLSFYIELGTNRVKHRYVKLVKVNPIFNGEEIVYGDNMIDLKRSVDFTDVATALIALGPEDDDGNRLIIEMKDDEAQEQLGLPYRYLWQIYEPESDDTKMTESRLKTLARTKLNKVKSASVTYTIQSTQLDVKVGDMIRVKNEDFTPELYVEAEIIEIKYNAFNKLCDYKFGILTEYTREEVYEQFNKLLETLRKRLENLKHNTENIINERFEEELKDLERYIHKSPTPPLNPKEGDLWLDTSHNQVAVLKRYENGQWIKSSVSEAHDINAPTREETMYQMITERAHRLKNMMLNNFGLYNNLTNHKYYMDLPQEIRDMFSKSFVAQSNAYSKFESDFNYINSEQPTIGLILTAMESAIQFEELSIDYSNAYAQIRAVLDNYLEILQRQYSEEKYLDALKAVADRIEGIEVVEGQLVGGIDVSKDVTTVLQEVKDDFLKDTVSREQYNTDMNGIVEDLKHEQTERLQLANQITDRVTIEDYEAYKGQQAGTISRLETSIDQNGKIIALKADAEDLDSLDKTLSKKQSELEIEAGRIEGTVKGLNTQLQEATASFKTTTDGLKGLVQENATGIGKNTSLIEQKAREIRLSIDTRTSGGRNLLPYSDLPEDLRYWGTNYSTSGTTLNINNFNFSSYLWVNKDASGTGTSIVASSPRFTVVEGTELTISFQATGFQNSYDDMRYMAWIPIGQDNQSIDTPKRTQIGTEANKKVYQYEVTTTPNFTGEAYIIFGTRRQDVSKAARFYLKNAKVEEGNTSSGWSVSPTDTAERWAEIKLTTDNISSEVGKKVGQNEVISSINQTAEKVKIDANKIELTAGSEIRLAVDGLNGLGKASNMLRHTLVSEENLKYFTNINGGTNVDTSVSNLDGQTYYLARALSSQSPSYVAVQVNRYADPRIRWEKGKDYKLSFKARKSSRTTDFLYTYIMRNDGANQSLGRPTRITPSEGVNEYLYEFDINPNWSSDEGYLLIGLQPESNANEGYWLRIRDIMLQEGTVATAYVPHSSEMVGTGNLFSAINLDDTGSQISGKKIELVGDVDMVNGTTRIKSLNLNRAVVTGGTGKNVITLNNNEFVSRGYFTRTWAGETDTAQLNLGIWHGRIMISNENTGYNLYLTEKGLSTTMAGATEGYSAGTLEFHSQRFNETSRGVTLHSTFGTVALISDESTIVTRSKLTNNIESEDYSVYIRPFMKTRPGTNEFQFYIKDGGSVKSTDGTLLYNGEASVRGSGIRFSKSGIPTIYATNSNGDIGSGNFDADQFWGTGFGSKSTNLYAMVEDGGEFRVTDKRGYNGGNTYYEDIRAKEIKSHGGFYSTHTSGNTYMGVATGEFRVTDNNFYNGGNTTYRDIKFANWRAMSHEKYKHDIKEWDLNVLPIFVEELKLHTYKLNSDSDTEKDLIHQGIILRENSNDDRFPSEWREGDGFNGNKVLWWTVKGVQELAQENYKKDEIIKEQGAEIEELKKQMSEVLALLNKE